MNGRGFADVAGNGGRAGASDALAGVSEVLVVGWDGRFRSVQGVLGAGSGRLGPAVAVAV